MPRLRSIVLFALAFVALELIAAAPAAAQLRRSSGNDNVQSSRSSSRPDWSRVDDRRRSDRDWDDDRDDRGRGKHEGRRDKRDKKEVRGNWCKDANRDARCDYAQSSRYPDNRYPDNRYPDNRYPNGRYPTGTASCVDRNRDGRCDGQVGLPTRVQLPLAELLSAYVVQP